MTSPPRPDPFKPALLIIDLQEDFCPPNGSLAVPDGRSVIPTINTLLTHPFPLKIATKDWHPPTHCSFACNHPPPHNIPFTSLTTLTNPLNPSETKETRLWPVHCVQGTPGAELVAELDTARLDKVLEKGMDERVEMYSAFHDVFTSPCVVSSGLAETLAEAGITHVYVVGLAEDYCVKWSAIDARKAGFGVFVVREGTRGVDPGTTEEAKREVEGAGGVFVGVEGVEVGWARELEG